jgi:hypothetical protein
VPFLSDPRSRISILRNLSRYHDSLRRHSARQLLFRIWNRTFSRIHTRALAPPRATPCIRGRSP